MTQLNHSSSNGLMVDSPTTQQQARSHHHHAPPSLQPLHVPDRTHLPHAELIDHQQLLQQQQPPLKEIHQFMNEEANKQELIKDLMMDDEEIASLNLAPEDLPFAECEKLLMKAVKLKWEQNYSMAYQVCNCMIIYIGMMN
jgi:hypothetical protein